MYTIEATDFRLEFLPVADTIYISVQCDGFSGIACFDTEDFLIADFTLQLKDVYERLEGCAKIRDLYETESHLAFIAQKFGYIRIQGTIRNEKRGCMRQLTFAYDVDQTCLKRFAASLAADYGKYAE